MSKNDKAPHPGGVEEIQTTAPEEVAAGAFLSPPGSLPGGRADQVNAQEFAVLVAKTPEAVTSALPIGDLEQLASTAGRLVATFAAHAALADERVRRAIGPALQAAREFEVRAEHAAIRLRALNVDSVGGQESPNREAETPDGAEAGGQDGGTENETWAEIHADAVAHNEQGEEVDR